MATLVAHDAVRIQLVPFAGGLPQVTLLLRLLASELAQLATPPPSTEAAPDPGRAPGAVLGDPDATDVLPRIS